MDKNLINRLELEMVRAADDLRENLAVVYPEDLERMISENIEKGLRIVGWEYLDYFKENRIIDKIINLAVAKWKEDRPAMYLELESRLEEIKLDPAAFANKVFDRMEKSHHKRVFFYMTDKILDIDKVNCRCMLSLLRGKFNNKLYSANFIYPCVGRYNSGANCEGTVEILKKEGKF